MASYTAQVHLLALAITVISEGLGMAGCSALAGRSRRLVLRDTALAVGVNLVTHTLFWYTFPLVKLGGTLKLYAFEGLIVGIEAIYYVLAARYTIWQATIVSFLLNLISFSLGIYILN